ncbi:MAG TPA: TIGR03936 family radical SAM-associated protein [Candidatus Omnitrophota bacterium]|nr:TIGR03936 family radical SAM-associated protein [Candidatus Omnitrophota bacterium]
MVQPAEKYRLNFYKKGDMVYISHLDLMSLFRRAIRRARLPFVLTQGFTPLVRISMPVALKLGKESEKEELTVWFSEKIDPCVVMEKLNNQLPEGIKILDMAIIG